jgi:hypothetical protein
VASALILVVNFAQAVVILVQPAWQRFRLLVRLATDIAALGILVCLLQGNHWIMLTHPGGDADNALNAINTYEYYGILAFAFGVALVTCIGAWKLIRSARRQ